ncbi:DUF2844 domain-containing protein [Paraburkholderia sp.]|uniref:DUF2844 domain-containing protein n=1 Tax=Paraburkholderia sp. TaxID=1926495 RepID=UPI00239EDBA5|nr:DUF2844 domain-containing protein [Paraburkholderia sp.]MDE1181117.1 DUF2844 domain-containing protein [Paraburkholderia sp.]
MTRRAFRIAALTIALATGGGIATPAFAELGGLPSYPASTTPSTRLVLKSTAAAAAATSGAAASNYTVDTTTLASGTVVSEYVGHDGTVFAIVWNGPTIAPLDTLLGAYFPTYKQGIADVQAARGGGFGPAAVRQSGLVVETGGHMGAFHGRAYLPPAVPQGLSVDDIQ